MKTGKPNLNKYERTAKAFHVKENICLVIYLASIFFILFLLPDAKAQTQNFAWARIDEGTGADAGNAITTDAAGNVYTAGYFDSTVDFNPGAGVSYLTSAGATDVFIMKTDASGNFIWAKRVGGPGFEYASSIAVDASGNVYISGEFNGVADFDPGAGVFNLTKLVAFQGAAFLLKLDLSGNFVWAKQFGGNTGTFIINKILLDASANVFVTGASVYTNDFDPNAGTVSVVSVYEDAYLLKLTTNGVFSYVKMISSTIAINYAIGMDMEMDPSGNIFIGGIIHGTFDLDPGAGVASFTTLGFGDCFIVKYTAAGNYVWGGITGGVTGSTTVWNSQLAADALGNIYITNYCNGGIVDFDIKAGVFNVDCTSGKTSIQKLNSSGNLIWVKTLAGATWSTPICSGPTGVYLSSNFSNSKDFNPGAGVYNLTSNTSPNTGFKEDDGYVLKIDTGGNFIWALKYGSLYDDLVNQICIDASENIHSTGCFIGDGDFDPGAGVKNLTSNGNQEIFVQKLNSAGGFLWAYGLGGETYQVVVSTSVNVKNTVYSTGYFEGGLTNYVGAKGGFDIFVESINTNSYGLAKNFYMGGPGDDRGSAIVTDTANNIYVTGYFSLAADFAPNRNKPANPLTSAGGKDIFVLKMNSSGNLVWAKRIGNTLDEESNSIALDAFGNLLVTGYYQGTVDFNPGVGLNSLTSVGGLDAFVLKLDTAGNFVWARSMGGTSNDIGNAITADAAGNVISTGVFNGTADMDPTGTVSNIISVGSIDLFIQKLNSTGTLVWAKAIGSAGNDKGTCITTDALNNVICAGSYAGTADFDPGVGVNSLVAPNVLGEIFLLQLSSTGNFSWVKSMGGAGSDLVSGLDLDKYGNIYTTGFFNGTADFDPNAATISNYVTNGATDVFVHCYRPANNTWFVKTFGSTGGDFGIGIVLDDSSSFYTVGNFAGTVDFDPGAGIVNLTAMGASDIFIQKMRQLSPLPIELISFNAHVTSNNAVYCDWSTATEQNNDYFTIEKSKDGKLFNEAGRVDGAGNSSSRLDYGFLDNEPFQGLSYYRLKQTDFDGETSYSKVVAVTIDHQNKINVYPALTTGVLHINGISSLESSTIDIINYQGKVLISLSKNQISENNKLDLTLFSNGVYFVRINIAERQITVKIVKS